MFFVPLLAPPPLPQKALPDQKQEQNKKEEKEQTLSWKPLKLLSDGTGGRVYIIQCENDGKQYIFKEARSKQAKRFLKNEASHLAKLRDCNHIIYMYDYLSDENCMVLEYLPEGDFFNYLVEKSESANSLGEEETKYILRQMVNILNDLRKNFHIVHRDLKPENFLIRSFTQINEFEFPNVVLIDFGFASPIDEVNIKDKFGSPQYAAPEIQFEKEWKINSYLPGDVWALGIMIYLMMELDVPIKIKEKDKEETLKMKYKIISNKKKLNWSLNLQDLYSKMVRLNPNQRITLEEILEHPWMKST